MTLNVVSILQATEHYAVVVGLIEGFASNHGLSEYSRIPEYPKPTKYYYIQPSMVSDPVSLKRVLQYRAEADLDI